MCVSVCALVRIAEELEYISVQYQEISINDIKFHAFFCNNWDTFPFLIVGMIYLTSKIQLVQITKKACIIGLNCTIL